MIDRTIIQDAFEYLRSLDHEAFSAEVDRVGLAQPHLAALLASLLDEAHEAIVTAALVGFVTTHRAFEAACPGRLPVVESQAVEKSLKRMNRGISRATRNEAVAAQLTEKQPALGDLAIDLLESAMERDPGIDPADYVDATLLLITQIDALHDATFGSSPTSVVKRATPGRNEPCPCGSGRKYKNCCRDKDAGAARDAGVSSIHDVDRALVREIVEWARGRGLDSELLVPDLFEDESQILGPYLAYDALLDGRSLASRFESERGWSLDARQRGLIAAQSRSWISVWEVTSVDPGRGLELVDLISGQTRAVWDVSASRVARPRLALLGRVVDFEGVSILGGSHPEPLGPEDATWVVDTWKKEARPGRKNRIDVLRTWRSINLLAELWDDALDEHYERTSAGPALRNTEGDEIVFVKERWTFAETDRDQILTRLSAMDQVQREPDGDCFVFLHGKTVVATVDVNERELVAGTNSIARADLMKERLSGALGKLATWKIRSLVDLEAAMRETREAPEPEPPTGEEAELLRRLKTEHYEKWLDLPLPALGGKTPRQAAKSKAGRKELDVLLKGLELRESAEPDSTRFDVRPLRKILGLDN